MALPSVTAASVMDDAAALLNDVNKTSFTYVVQIPYLNIALKELRKHFELSNLSITDQTNTTPIILAAAVTELSFTSTPALPANLVDIRKAWQRPTGSGQQYVPLPRIDGLPMEMNGIAINTLYGYVWEDQKMKFLPANVNTDIVLEYIQELFPIIALSTDTINCRNGDSYLAARTAALIAKYVSEDDMRSQELNTTASIALDEVLGIGAKGKQQMVTRRRPFRQSFKSRGY